MPMLATFIAALIVFAAAIVGMAIGVISSNRCLRGTCGGLSQLPNSADHSLCDACATGPVADKHETVKHE